MPRSLRVTPVVIDYQLDRHCRARRRQDAAHDDGPSVLFYLLAWTLSTGLFLLAFYIASEAPFPTEGVRRESVTVSRPGLAMTSGRASRAAAGTTLNPLAGSRAVTPR